MNDRETIVEMLKRAGVEFRLHYRGTKLTTSRTNVQVEGGRGLYALFLFTKDGALKHVGATADVRYR